MNKRRFRPLWTVPCMLFLLLLCFWLDERGEQKRDVDPYLLSFSDNCASYEDDLLCSLDALTPWEWDIVWFLPAGPEDAQEVKLPAVKTPVQLKQAVGDAPAALSLIHI